MVVRRLRPKLSLLDLCGPAMLPMLHREFANAVHRCSSPLPGPNCDAVGIGVWSSVSGLGQAAGFRVRMSNSPCNSILPGKGGHSTKRTGSRHEPIDTCLQVVESTHILVMTRRLHTSHLLVHTESKKYHSIDRDTSGRYFMQSHKLVLT